MIISLSPFALENLVSGEPAATRPIRVTGAAFSGATVWTILMSTLDLSSSLQRNHGTPISGITIIA